MPAFIVCWEELDKGKVFEIYSWIDQATQSGVLPQDVVEVHLQLRVCQDDLSDQVLSFVFKVCCGRSYKKGTR